MMMPNEWADRMYLGARSKQCHWVPFGDHKALCGAGKLLSHDEWYGTGDMDEYDYAASLTVCPDCAKKAS